VSRAGSDAALKDFEALGAALKRRAKEAAAQAVRERARQAAEEARLRQQERLRDEFARTVGPVKQMPD
jgi:cation transport ATPase